MSNLKVTWVDKGRTAKNPPNPAYPNGIDIDLSKGASVFCSTPLPYPAARVGMYLVKCDTCGQNALITTAGRPDDPRLVILACKGH